MTGTAQRLDCPQCGTHLGAGLLACPRCRWLVHGQELKAIAADAEAAERGGDLATAASRWQDALRLLPADAKQAEVITARVRALGDRMLQEGGGRAKEPHRRPVAKIGGAIGIAALAVWKLKFVFVFLLTKGKLLLLGLTKSSTLFSMLLFLGVYWSMWGWKFAAGIAISLYIHEMGHVAELARYGIRASPPMFVPGLGALVRMHQYPPAPGLDARVGLAGPLWGLGAAIAAYAVFLITDYPMWAAIAKAGAWLNLFNLLPIWSLDGGRAFRALTRQERWIAAAVLGALWFWSAESLLVLLLIGAVWRALTEPAEKPDRTVLLLYCALAASLTVLSRIPVPAATP